MSLSVPGALIFTASSGLFCFGSLHLIKKYILSQPQGNRTVGFIYICSWGKISKYKNNPQHLISPSLLSIWECSDLGQKYLPTEIVFLREAIKKELRNSGHCSKGSRKKVWAKKSSNHRKCWTVFISNFFLQFFFGSYGITMANHSFQSLFQMMTNEMIK